MKQTITVLICCCILQSFCFAQMTVDQVPILDQLPSNSINRMLQDKDGFIWLGTTNGLCRYDAYKVLVFNSDINSPYLFANHTINCLVEDFHQRIWIGTSVGVNILYKNNYRVIELDDENIKGVEIKGIQVAKDSSIYLGVGSTVYRYRPDLTVQKIYDDFPPKCGVNSFLEDAAGNIWATAWNAGLYKLDRNTDKFIKYPKIGTGDNPHKMYQDSAGQYWICTWGSGLYRFYPDRAGDEMYERIEVVSTEKLLHSNIFYNIIRDDTYGYFWALSYSGLHVLDCDQDGNIHDAGFAIPKGMYTNIFLDIIKDHDGNLWLGTSGEGVITISFDKPVVKNYTLDVLKENTGFIPNITTVYEDKTGIYWIRQNRLGLCFFDPANNKIFPVADNPQLDSQPGLKDASCITGISHMNEVWVGLEYNPVIYCFELIDKNPRVKRTIDLSTILPNASSPVSILEDGRENIWVTTATNLFCKSSDKPGLQVVGEKWGNITGITEDINNTIWLSTDNGLFQLTYRGNFFDIVKTGNLPIDKIRTICSDKFQRIWMATYDERLLAYDIRQQTTTDYTRDSHVSGQPILDIVADDFGHLWISSNKQIIEFDPTNGASTNYTYPDGTAVNSFLKNSVYQTRDGKIIFGGNHGFCVFTPSDNLGKPALNSKVVICDIKLNNKSIYQKHTRATFDHEHHLLTIHPSDRNIEIDFSSLNYSSSGKIRYAYKLDGVDNDWIYTDSKRQFAVYNQLRKGSYTFLVKATDKNGLWGEEITQLTIVKLPAVYETWWAFLLYAVLFAAGVYWLFRIYSNRMRLQNELRIAQIEKEKSEELTQIKLRYFTNISHDLLTPLTIMSCAVDEMESSGSTPQMGILRANINRLRRLLQQILDFRKVESGNMKLKVSQGDIATFIRNICDHSFQSLIRKQNIRFTFAADPEHIQAYFDADKVDKIVFNLLSNAFKYTPKNGSIGVVVQEKEMNGQTAVCINVFDTGIGILEQDIPKIFTHFYNNTMVMSETHGIGLSLTKDLVELHHGTISVESIQTEGTTFTVEIPIDKKSFSENELSEMNVTVDEISYMQESGITENEEQNTADKNNEKSANILFVEDNEELLTLIQRAFIAHYHVNAATNGLQALDILQSTDIDIVVSDVAMPGMDGLELCRKIKSDLQTSHIAVILLTAKSSAEDRIACYDAGADGYIAKPFDMPVLSARIHNLVANRKNRQQEFKTNAVINISTLEYQSADEQFLNNMVQIIESFLSESEFDLDMLASKAGMSKSSLYRKVKSMTGLSPHEFIRNIKLKHACRMLKNKLATISEVAYALGFSNPKYFTACFKAEFGLTPTEYQKEEKPVAIEPQ